MRSILVLILLCTTSIVFGQLSTTVVDNHNERRDQIDIPAVHEFTLSEFNNTELIHKLSATTFQTVKIALNEDQDVDVYLALNSVVSEDYFVSNERNETIRPGQVVTAAGSSRDGGQVRLTFAEHFTYGFIEYGDETYWIEPAWYYENGASESFDIVVYKQSDVHPEHAMTCAAGETATKLQHWQENAPETSGARVGQCYEVELAVASDFSMYDKYNSSTTQVENHNIGVINNVNGNYTGEFLDDIEFVIKTQWISTCSGCDPWTNSTEADQFLFSFTAWGENGGFQTTYDLGEIWTDRDFDGPTIGIAWVDGLCNNNRYHALQDWVNNAALLRVTTSHEIGHNFSSQHAPTSDFIMSATVSITDDWHNNTLNVISNYIASKAAQGGCFSACSGGGTPPTPIIETLAQNLCTGTTTKFFDRSSGDPTSWLWTFPGGDPATSTEQHPVVTYNAPGTFPVTLSVTNVSGSNQQTFPSYIAVGNNGTAFPLYQDFDNGFDNWSVINPDNSTTWDLYSGDFAPGGSQCVKMDNFNYNSIGQRDAVLSPEFDLAGYQTASLHVEYAHAATTSGQRDSLIVYISSDGGANYQRLYANAENGSGNFATRVPSATAFELTSIEEWCGLGGFGANCIDLDLSNYLGQRDLIVRIENYTNSGNNTYLDRVYVSTNCFDLPAPIAAFVGNPTSGCSPLIVQFEDQSQNSPFAWNWTFENGTPATSTEQHPEVVFTTPGLHAVTLTVENETGVNLLAQTAYIEVLAEPIADFDYTVQNDTVHFQNLSTGALGYIWDFGDGNSSMAENPIHRYANDGTYDVKLTVIGDCGNDDITKSITIGTPPSADFVSSNTEGCFPLTVDFVNQSSANTVSLQWVFEGGTPTTSIDPSPMVTYQTPGVYDVLLIAINGTGTDTMYMPDLVVVLGPPNVDFTVDHDGFLTLDFTYTGDAYDDILWTFDNGHTSTDENPSHQYHDMFAGGLEYQCIASNVCGADTVSDMLSFTTPLVTINVPNAGSSQCVGSTFDFAAQAWNNDTDYQWIFEGGSPSNSNQAIQTVTYDQDGVFDVSLIVSFNGVSDTAYWSDLVEVTVFPTADFIQEQGQLTNTSLDADHYEWYVNGQFRSMDEHLEFDSIGMFEVLLIAFNDCGPDSLIQNVSISSTTLIDELDHGMVLFPNPTDGLTSVEFLQPLSDYSLSIYDTKGRLIHSYTNLTDQIFNLDLTDQANGIYLIRVTTAHSAFTARVILSQ